MPCLRHIIRQRASDAAVHKIVWHAIALQGEHPRHVSKARHFNVRAKSSEHPPVSNTAGQCQEKSQVNLPVT